MVDDIYYAKQEYQGIEEGISLQFGEPVEVLDISDGRYWLVKSIEPTTGKPIEGLVPSAILVPHPPRRQVEQYEAETGQEVPRAEGEISESAGPPQMSTNLMVMPNSLFGGYKPPRSLLMDEPCADLTSETTGLEPAMEGEGAPLKRIAPLSNLASGHFESSEDSMFGSHPRVVDRRRDASRYRESSEPCEDPRLFEHVSSHPEAYGSAGENLGVQQEPHELSSSLHSLPATFSPRPPPSNRPYLGYNPMEIPTTTMSQPELVPTIRVDPAETLDARAELRRLQDATVRVGDLWFSVASGRSSKWECDCTL